MTAGWTLIVPHLPAAVADAQRLVAGYRLGAGAVEQLRVRYEVGAREHPDEVWMAWPPLPFALKRAEERDSLIVLTAMWRAAMAARESRA